MALEKRIYVSPVDFPPISRDSGKMQGSCHVNVVRSIYEDGKLVGELLNHRVSVVIRPDGSWSYEVDEPDEDIRSALENAWPSVAIQILLIEKQRGIINHEITHADGSCTKVTYEELGGECVRKETKI